MTYLGTIVIVTCDDVVALVLHQRESGTEDGLGEDRHYEGDEKHLDQCLHSLNTGL